MRYWGIFTGLFLLTIKSYGQSKPVPGFVIDKESKLRLARVYVYNASSGEEGAINNPKGEFAVKAKQGDTLVAALGGYAPDTVVYNGQNAMVFQLKAIGITLKQVNITGKAPSPKEQHEKNVQNFKYKTDRGSTKDLINTGMGSAGLGIDALYNLLSKEGSNARRLQGVLEKDYHEAVINARFRPEYVKMLLKIEDEEAKDFMAQYRPTYAFAIKADEYEFVDYLNKCYASYKRNPNLLRPPKNLKVEFDPKKE